MNLPLFKNANVVGADPYGLNQHESGAKLDQGKNKLGLVLGSFANALLAVEEVGTYGAQKYSDDGWLHVSKGEQRYQDALFRHLLQDFAGEYHDQESGLMHAAHAAWNSLAVLELKLREHVETDQRILDAHSDKL